MELVAIAAIAGIAFMVYRVCQPPVVHVHFWRVGGDEVIEGDEWKHTIEDDNE